MAEEVLKRDKDLASLTEFEYLTQELASHKDNVLARLQRVSQSSETNGSETKEFVSTDPASERSLLSKKHWMPDRTCKVCYDCEAPFTLFRRRHHCRICGQIFCSDCSSHMVDGKLYNIQVARKKLSPSCNLSKKGSVRVCNYCFDQQSWRIQESSSGPENSEHRDSPSTSISALHPLCSNEGPPRPGEHNMITSLDEGEENRIVGESSPTADGSKSQNILEDAIETDNMISGRYWLDQKDVESDGTKLPPSLLNVPAIPQPVIYRIGGSTRDDKSGSLQTIADAHLRYIVSKLVEDEDIELRWINPLLKLIRTAVKKVKTSVRRGDKMDLRAYVKIKTIPGGQISDSRFIEGVVFRKNVAHKKMRRKVKDPRVLLLSCPIQFKGEHVYQEGGNRMSSLMTLIDQERLHLAIVVNKIVQLRPDVLVVQQTVSRIAQDALREAGISLVLNVKPSVMERLARSTGGHILRSPDYVENSLLRKDQLFGHCKDFEVKHFTEKGGKRTTLMFFECSRTHRHGTICLRGTTKEQLKKVKRVLRIGIIVAHNLKLETAFLNDECATYTEEEYKKLMKAYAKHEEKIANVKKAKGDQSPTRRTAKISKQLNRVQKLLKAHEDPADKILSFSPGIRVNVSEPYVRRRTRQAVETCGLLLQSISYGKFTRLEHNWQCEAPREEGHVFYGLTDISLGQFLESNCFDVERRCANSKCRRNVLYHNRYLTHGKGRIHFTVKLLDSHTAHELYMTKGSSQEGKKESKDEKKNISSQLVNKDATCTSTDTSHIVSGNAHPDDGNFNSTDKNMKTTREKEISKAAPNHPSLQIGQKDFSALDKNLETEVDNPGTASANSVAAAFSSAVAAARRAAVHAATEAMGPASPSGAGKYQVSGKEKILVCSFCRECDNRGPVVALSEDAYNMSFGKFLDLSFYNHGLCCRTGSCGHSLHVSYVRQFVKGNMIAQFQYDPIRPFKINFEHRLRYEPAKQKKERILEVGTSRRILGAMIAAFSRRVEDLKRYLEIDIEDTKARKPELVDDRMVLLTSVKELGCEIEQARTHLSEEIQKFTEIPADEPSFELNRIRRTVFEKFHDWNYTMARIRKPLMTHATAKGRRGELHPANSSLEGATYEVQTHPDPSLSLIAKSTPTSPHLKGESNTAASVKSSQPSGESENGPYYQYTNAKTTSSLFIAKTQQGAVSSATTSPRLMKTHSDSHQPSGRPRLGSGVDVIRLCHKVNPSEILDFDNSLSFNDLEFLASGTVDNSNSNDIDDTCRKGISGESKRTVYDPDSQQVPCRVHMLLPKLLNNAQIPIYEDEASSIIAYALASVEHARKIQQSATAGLYSGGSMGNESGGDNGDTGPAGQTEGDTGRNSTRGSSGDNWSADCSASKGTSKGSKLLLDSPPLPNPVSLFRDGLTLPDLMQLLQNPNLDLKFSDLAKFGTFSADPSTITKFQCKIYFARKFHALRHVFCGDEANFIVSMSRCLGWNATGGKSGSTFARTKCQRYIIKFVTRSEFKMLTDLAPSYFQFMAKACFHQLPTVLSKILGCYQVSWRRSNGDQIKTLHAIVMPNVFYSTPVTHIFDLKGSVRNRYVKRKTGERDRVLLDENFLEYTRGFPIPVEEKTKDEMRHAIRNDSKFLCDKDIVDYSVLVGLNESTRVMAIGIIDYVRQYTWERRIETGVKSISMMTGKASPTVISPDNYKVRFQLATERYFMMAPCQTSRAGLSALPIFSRRPIPSLGILGGRVIPINLLQKKNSSNSTGAPKPLIQGDDNTSQEAKILVEEKQKQEKNCKT